MVKCLWKIERLSNDYVEIFRHLKLLKVTNCSIGSPTTIESHIPPAPFFIIAMWKSFPNCRGVLLVFCGSLGCLPWSSDSSFLLRPSEFSAAALWQRATLRPPAASLKGTQELGSLWASLLEAGLFSITVKRCFSPRPSYTSPAGPWTSTAISWEVICEKWHPPCCSQPSLPRETRLLDFFPIFFLLWSASQTTAPRRTFLCLHAWELTQGGASSKVGARGGPEATFSNKHIHIKIIEGTLKYL